MRLVQIICVALVILCVFGEHNHEEHHHRAHHVGHRAHHEHLRAKHHEREQTHSSTLPPVASNNTAIGPIIASIHPHCSWVCNEINPDKSGLQILINVNLQTLAILNSTSSQAIILGKLITILDGQTGSANITDFAQQKVYSLKRTIDQSAALWLDSKEKFSSFFLNQDASYLKLLEKLTSNCTSENLNSSYSKILSDLRKIDSNISLTDITEILAKTQTDVLKDIFSKTSYFSSSHGLSWILNFNYALSGLFSQANKSNALTKLSDINIEFIYSARTGAEGFLNLLIEIGKNHDISKLFGNILNNPLELAKILNEFCVGSKQSVDEWLQLTYQIVNSLSGKGSIQELLKATINIETTQILNVSEARSLIDKAWNLTQTQRDRFLNASQLQGFRDILQQLQNNTFNFGGINIADILKELSTSPVGAIEATVKIVLKLGSPFGTDSVLKVIESAFGILNSTNNTSILPKLIPGLDISQLTNISSYSSILQSVLKGQNISQWLSPSFGLNVLQQVPIIGDIIKDVTRSFGGSLDITNLLNASSIVSSLQTVLKVPGQNLTSITDLEGLLKSGINLFNPSSWGKIINGGQLGEEIQDIIKNSSSLLSPGHWAKFLNTTSIGNITSEALSTLNNGIQTIFKGFL